MYLPKPKDMIAFEHGYNAGVNGRSKTPGPDLTMALAFNSHLDDYTASYDQGYDRAQKDRDLLLRGREQNDERYLQTDNRIERCDVRTGWF